jgi:uncharacterized cofD-like protein
MGTSKKNWIKRIWQGTRRELRWLMPGLGVKRWLLMILAGTTLLGVGLAFVLLDIYRTAPETWWLPILSILALRFLNRTLRAIIFGSIGLSLIVLGVWGFNRALMRPFVRKGEGVLDAVTAYRRKERGPHIVVIGGGTGLSILLRGLKLFTHNLTAIVTVADDGGSSGELRRNLGVLPPGDIRNCLTALSNDETLLTQLFQYRFGSGTGLEGHSLGNLFITALAEITGSFEEAVIESGRVLAVTGRVLPSTLQDVRLVAEIAIPGQDKLIQVKGESAITQAGGEIKRIWLEPNNPLAYPPTIQAILSADLIVIGPGSLYTSLLPDLLVPDLVEAVRASKAIKFFICNVASQPGETQGYTCGDHVRSIEQHVNGPLFDLVICNKNFSEKLPAGTEWIKPEDESERNYILYQANLVDDETPWRHDAEKIARTVMDLYEERTGPLTEREDVA